MAKSLCEKMQSIKESGDRSEALKSFDRDLYKAYKTMRAMDISDKDLFA
jgi:hypothetical protein